MKSIPTHIPVLLDETIKALAVQPGGRYIDATLGGGGHASAILEHSSPGGQLLGIDADPKAIKAARARLGTYSGSILLVNENFVDLQTICLKYDFLPVHGILFDLGLSSLQLNGNNRGFSFQHDAPLDMRLSPRQEVTAAQIINQHSERELARLIRTLGEEKHSRGIAHHIVRERPIKTTLHLAKIIERAVGYRGGRIHPATKTFQALRIAVNHELENLEAALKQAVKLLGFEGRLVVISYHSLEDRIVKRFMQQEAKGCLCPPGTPTCVCDHTPILRLVNKKVITPGPAEVQINPRSRSARLRTAERIVNQEERVEATENLFSLLERQDGNWKKPVQLDKLRRTWAIPSLSHCLERVREGEILRI